MITLPISHTELRAMHGANAALPVLCLLALSGTGLDLGHLETGTGFKRSALVQACRLLHHMHLVDYDEARPNALRNIRMIAAVQLPLPGTHTPTPIPAGPVSDTHTHTDGETVIEARPSRGPASLGQIVRQISHANLKHANLTPVVVGGVNNTNTECEVKQQQHQQNTPNSSDVFRVRGLLRGLGVWPNVLAGLEGAALADVLGWIAYVSDPANRIGNKPALVSANLGSGRQAGPAYTPFRICRACHLIESVCECETPELYWPAEYDTLAIQPPAPGWGESAEEWLARRWHCPKCLGYPCQCAEAQE